MRRKPDKWIYTAAIAAVLALAGCASAASDTDWKTQTSVPGLATTQLPKSYPCQNLHVRPVNCPPR
jgi:hypothetical protein